MDKKEKNGIFLDETYSKPPLRNYPNNKILYNHIDEIWSIDLAGASVDKKFSNNERYGDKFVIIDFFYKFLLFIPLKICIVKQ